LNWWAIYVIMATVMPNPLNNSGIGDNHKGGAVADFFQAKHSTSHAD
jgi:hypothetical protein